MSVSQIKSVVEGQGVVQHCTVYMYSVHMETLQCVFIHA